MIEEYNKSRGVAIFLALIFGELSWLYTWKADWGKFIFFTLFVPFMCGLLGGGEILVIGTVFSLSFAWIIAFFVALVRPDSFYRYY